MNDLIVLQDREHHGHCDAIVGAQRCAVGTHPVPVDNDADRFSQKIDLLVRLTGKDHVDMSLQRNGFGVLAAFRSVLGNNDVISVILHVLEPFFFRKRRDIVTDLLRMMGSVRNRRDLAEIVEHSVSVGFLKFHVLFFGPYRRCLLTVCRTGIRHNFCLCGVLDAVLLSYGRFSLV